MVLFLILFHFSNFSPNKKKKKPRSPLGLPIRATPLHPCTPAPLHLTFPLVTRVHLRRPSDFRLTLASIVAVMHNKVSCYSPVRVRVRVRVRAVVSRLILNRAQINLRDVFRWHGSKSHEEADIKIEGILHSI